MATQNQDKIQFLINQGVRILDPEGVDIGEDVDPDRISGERVAIYPGCRIYGNDTLIMAGAILGFEGPATIVNCQIGPGVELRGGFFRQSVFLEKVVLGSSAQIREGCILEEESSGAHSVGLKQTILFPFVTLGSLINFCDCLISGGTSRKDHSEVGSSYIHFNYTLNQDKATPSLIGDVPRGVMLNQPPIFLGGQGGLVGPAQVGFGTVTAAGTILRRDCPGGGKLIIDTPGKKKEIPFHPGLYREVKRKTIKNIVYIASLFALRRWYLDVRSLFLPEELSRGAREKIDLALEERLKRLKTFAGNLPESSRIHREMTGEKASLKLLLRKKELFEKREEVDSTLRGARDKEGDRAGRDAFLETVSRVKKEVGGDYLAAIRSLDPEDSARGTAWLQGIVDGITRNVLDLLPSFKRT